MLALLVIEVGDTLDGEVIGLRRTGGPDNFSGIRVDQLGNLITRILHRFLGLPSKHVGAGSWIAKHTLVGQAARHDRNDPGVNGRG